MTSVLLGMASARFLGGWAALKLQHGYDCLGDDIYQIPSSNHTTCQNNSHDIWLHKHCFDIAPVLRIARSEISLRLCNPELDAVFIMQSWIQDLSSDPLALGQRGCQSAINVCVCIRVAGVAIACGRRALTTSGLRVPFQRLPRLTSPLQCWIWSSGDSPPTAQSFDHLRP